MTDPAPPPAERALSRRRLLKRSALGATALGAAAFGYAAFVEPFWWKSVYLDLPIEHLPDGLVGRTLVQISDLHIGPRVPEDYITEAVAAVGRFAPDLVVITGDVVHYLHPRDGEQASRVLSHLPGGRLGTVAILGNHDYACGWGSTAAARDVERRLRDLGVHVLRNDLMEIGGLQIVGLDDLWAGRFRPRDVLPRVDREGASLVLSHNPDTLDRPGWDGWRGWVLAGHTHGGQCKPPFLPPPLLPVQNHRYTQGEFDLGDGRRLYINPGLGYLRQVRFNVRPEITVFTLRRA